MRRIHQKDLFERMGLSYLVGLLIGTLVEAKAVPLIILVTFSLLYGIFTSWWSRH